MKLSEYKKIHLAKAWNNTWGYLKDQIAIKLSIVIFLTIVNFTIGIKFYQFLIAIGIEFGGLLFMLGLLFLQKYTNSQESMDKEKQENINSLQNIIASLEKQQKPELQITLDENENGYIYDEPRDYGQEIGLQISERIIRIRVNNLSRYQAVEGVEVMLTDIDKCKPEEKGKLPVHLKLRNDSNNRDSFTIPADGYKFFEVIHASFFPNKRKMCEFSICHIEQRNNYTET